MAGRKSDQRSPSGKTGEQIRLSVTLDHADHKRVKSLAEGHQPAVSMGYVINYAVKQLLREMDDATLAQRIRDPRQGGG